MALTISDDMITSDQADAIATWRPNAAADGAGGLGGRAWASPSPRRSRNPTPNRSPPRTRRPSGRYRFVMPPSVTWPDAPRSPSPCR
jgi:hypothetical protein